MFPLRWRRDTAKVWYLTGALIPDFCNISPPLQRDRENELDLGQDTCFQTCPNPQQLTYLTLRRHNSSWCFATCSWYTGSSISTWYTRWSGYSRGTRYSWLTSKSRCSSITFRPLRSNCNYSEFIYMKCMLNFQPMKPYYAINSDSFSCNFLIDLLLAHMLDRCQKSLCLNQFYPMSHPQTKILICCIIIFISCINDKRNSQNIPKIKTMAN